MSVFKCKMCGGTIEFEQGATVGVCDSCGTKQTLPRLDDDKKANLYDRANHFRRNNDFDKAMSIYEQILNEDGTDAEAYWSLVLCRYGIEYVEDPSSRRRIPTVNRAQFTSIFADEDYKSALQYADGYQKALYEEEAKAIDDIQKGILAISQKEEPFDVFICYKETDNNGRRTPDSVLANDLYHQLTQEGFKVFFARITLEDKLGSAYEPYIFAALNSAKVMVALGTKPEFFNAVWVKNEWSRYLALIKNGANKMLIPAYKDMDPYDLPEEFSHLQAQDMSKLGFMQDLIRGIKKIISADAPKTTVKETVVVSGGSPDTAPLLKRAFMFLEDGNWQEADEYCEKVLDRDPENAQAYLGKLMAELHVRKQAELRDCEKPFDDSNNYQKAIRFAEPALAEELKGDIVYINERNENARLTGIYDSAVNAMENAKSEREYKAAADVFKTISGFKDADDLAELCCKEAVYTSAKKNMTVSLVVYYESAIEKFRTISGYKDADEQIHICMKKIEELKAESERNAEERRIAAERRAKMIKRIAAIATPIICACILFAILLKTVIIPNGKYNEAVALSEAGKLDEAYEIFREISGYKDSAEKAYSIGLEPCEIGGYIKLGTYEQDNDASNGKENIEWLILAKEENRALVISKYALDCQPYNTSQADVTWKTCTLRKWLNNNFVNEAFSKEERSKIAATTVSADKNPRYDAGAGSITQDKVFLLSIGEAEKYLTSGSARQCQGTAYCYAQGAYESDIGTCLWWLRSPGKYQYSAATVHDDGGVYYIGYFVNDVSEAVRPALWINLDS